MITRENGNRQIVHRIKKQLVIALDSFSFLFFFPMIYLFRQNASGLVSFFSVLTFNECRANIASRNEQPRYRTIIYSHPNNVAQQPFHITPSNRVFKNRKQQSESQNILAPDQYKQSGAFTFVITTTATATAKTQKQIYQ